MNLLSDGDWNILKGKLKEKYGDITDNELSEAEGNEDQIIGLLQKKLDKSKSDVLSELKELLNSK